LPSWWCCRVSSTQKRGVVNGFRRRVSKG
jgi:hypothetical protein